MEHVGDHVLKSVMMIRVITSDVWRRLKTQCIFKKIVISKMKILFLLKCVRFTHQFRYFFQSLKILQLGDVRTPNLVDNLRQQAISFRGQSFKLRKHKIIHALFSGCKIYLLFRVANLCDFDFESHQDLRRIKYFAILNFEGRSQFNQNISI